MEKYAWKAMIIEGKLSEYQRRHNEIWPEMLEVLKKAGIKNVIKNQNTKVEMNGKMYSVLGQIGMYHTVIDITGNENLKVGQEVELEVRTVYIDNRIKRQYQ